MNKVVIIAVFAVLGIALLWLSGFDLPFSIFKTGNLKPNAIHDYQIGFLVYNYDNWFGPQSYNWASPTEIKLEIHPESISSTQVICEKYGQLWTGNNCNVQVFKPNWELKSNDLKLKINELGCGIPLEYIEVLDSKNIKLEAKPISQLTCNVNQGMFNNYDYTVSLSGSITFTAPEQACDNIPTKPCANAVWNDYPDCEWDSSNCQMDCNNVPSKPCDQALWVGYPTCQWDESNCQTSQIPFEIIVVILLILALTAILIFWWYM